MSEPSSSSSSSAAAKSDAELEEMLDRMLTRLALSDDSKLQALLARLLPMTISSLSSTSSAVRNKVLEILSHVNKRVKYQPDIGLPLLDLWKIYTEDNVASIVKNFCIVYIEMAFERIDQQEKQIMAPTSIANVSKIPQQHQEIVLRIVTKVIGECHSTGVSSEVVEKYRAVTVPQDRELFLDFCLFTMLYQPSSQGGGSCPGLSVSQANKVTGNLQLKSDILLSRKLGILHVIEGMDLPAEVVYPLYLAASSDSQEAVVKRGDELLKKKASGVTFEDVSLIKRLFLLCNGTIGTDTGGPDSKIQPANATLRAKILNVFCHSIAAANTFPSTLQCIFACIYGHGTTMRLKQLGMEFTVWVFKHARLDQLQMMGPVILTGIIKSLDSNMTSESDSSARETKTFAYQAIGLLEKRMPQLFRDKIDMAVRLFGALKLEAPIFRSVIQEATVALAVAYKGATSSVLKDLEGLLLENYQQGGSEARFCAVRWATWIYDLHHCASRFVCMLGTGDSKLDIREMAIEGLFPWKEDEQPVDHDISLKFPKLRDMLDYILKQQPMLESTELREQKLLFPSEVYVFIIKFLLKCFESDREENETSGLSSEFMYAMEKLFVLLEHTMVVEGSTALQGCASTALLAIASRTPRVGFLSD
ncbi:hypothetical protein MLD38_004156 [Melastoma candidum]|uniref:Uncharacterized protein n=1 Tax=Melastoma candidum TaxID=119954 RepID=A0ACB9S4J1_9MYRT|nr:hypothetical protein MLD38_004156 [Melastoma candidum]